MLGGGGSLGVASRAGLLPAAVAHPAGPAGRGWPGGGCRPAPHHGWHHDRSARARPAALRPAPADGCGSHRLLTAFFAAFRSARGTALRPGPADGSGTDRPITDLLKAPRTALRSALGPALLTALRTAFRTAPRPQPPPHHHPIRRARPRRPSSGQRSASQPPTQSLPRSASQPPPRPPSRRAARPRRVHPGAGARRVAHHGR